MNALMTQFEENCQMIKSDISLSFFKNASDAFVIEHLIIHLYSLEILLHYYYETKGDWLCREEYNQHNIDYIVVNERLGELNQ